jgi:hypothetical protein
MKRLAWSTGHGVALACLVAVSPAAFAAGIPDGATGPPGSTCR